jgi:hypothetical protein
MERVRVIYRASAKPSAVVRISPFSLCWPWLPENGSPSQDGLDPPESILGHGSATK